jgi:ABC-type dipeptide/oligopeptide/nickel transport system permease component
MSRVGGVAASFVNKKVPAVTFSDGYIQSTYADTLETVDINALDNTAKSVMSYLKRVVFKDTRIDYLYPSEKMIILLLLITLVLNTTLNYMYKYYPTKKVLNIQVEDIYLSFLGIILRKIIRVAFPLILSVFALSILANINPETNIQIVQNRRESNISVYLTLKDSVTYLRSLFDLQLHQSIKVGNIYEVISTSSLKSISLLSCSLMIAVVVGIMRGMYEGSNRKNASLKSLGSIVVYSIPDVLIVLLGLILYTFIARNFPQYKDIIPLKDFIFPALTLSIIPTIYISRITLITIEEEIKKDYIKNARAIGLSTFKVYTFELLPVILFKVLDTMPTIMAMLLSNMIIVEYLFNYVGIVYYLLYFYKINDVYRFVPLAMTLGLIFIVFVYSTKWLSRFINPLKRKVDE